MKIYIAGPMTWHPQFNYPAFIEAASVLRERGYDVVSPAELDNPEDRAAALASVDGNPATYAGSSTWGDFLSRDVKLIADGGIEGIAVLPGWQNSSGARLETFVGKALKGIPVYALDPYTNELLTVTYLALVRAWANIDSLSFNTKPLTGVK